VPDIGIWYGENMGFPVWWNDELTEEKDGYDEYETYYLKLWDNTLKSDCVAEYAMSDGDDYFIIDAVSYIGSINCCHIEPPVLSQPVDDSEVDITSVIFIWQEEANLDNVEIMADNNSDFSSPEIFEEIDQNVLTYTLSNEPLTTNTNYYWRMRSIRDFCVSEWSDLYMFHITGYPVEWTVQETESSATVEIPPDADLTVEDREIVNGDVIGMFFIDDQGVEQCAGYGTWSYEDGMVITVYGDDPNTTEIEGYTENEDYKLKVWDAARGRALDANFFVVTGRPFFVDEGLTVLGGVTGADDQEIELIAGWNMISSYRSPLYPELEKVYEDIEDDLLLVRNVYGNLYFPSLDINSIGDWNMTEGYKVYMYNDVILNISGLKVKPEQTDIALPEGWSIIPYLRVEEMSVVTALEGIADAMLFVKDVDGNMYFPELGINTIGNLVPGRGYQIYMMEAATLTYPANSSPRTVFDDSKLTPKAKYIVPEIKRTGNNMSLIIETDVLLNGSEIGIWTSDNVLVGSGKVYNGKAAITIWGDNEQTKEIDGARELESLKAMVFDKGTATSYEIELGNIYSLLSDNTYEHLEYITEDIILAKAVSSSNYDADDILLTCKPNPTTGEAVIEYQIEDHSFVSIKLYSMTGQLIQTITESEATNGLHTLNFDVSILANGVYNLQMIVGGRSVNRLLVICK
jgi:hypothetical protein